METAHTQIGQHFISVEQRDHFVPAQLMFLSILHNAESKYAISSSLSFMLNA